MQRLFKQLSKDSIIYGLGGALGTFVGVLITPILTRIFHPSDYGVIELISTSVTIVTIFMTMGMDTAMGVKFFAENDESQRRRIISTTLLFTGLCATGLAVVLMFFGSQISFLLFHSTAYADILRVAIAGLPIAIALNFLLETLRFHFRPWAYTFLSLGRAIAVIVMTYALVVMFQRGVIGVFSANLLGSAALFVIGLLVYSRYVRGRPSLPILRGLLRVGLPLIPAGLAAWALNLIDRYFLIHYRDLTEVGLYSLGVRVASVLTLFVSAFQLSWSPFSLSIAKRDDAKQFYSSVLTYYTLIGCLLALGVCIYSREVILIFATQTYLDASRVIIPLAFSWIAFGLYYIVAIGVTIVQKTEHISWTTMVAAAINVIINFIFIPRYGMIGAAYATLVSYFFSSALLLLVSQHYYPIPYRWWPVIKTVLFTAVALAVAALLPEMTLVVSIVVKAAIIGAWLVACYWLIVEPPVRRVVAMAVFHRQSRKSTP